MSKPCTNRMGVGRGHDPFLKYGLFNKVFSPNTPP